MVSLTSEQPLLCAERIAEITGGELHGHGGLATSVSTDARTLRPGEVFVALAGDRHDGHDFLGEAVSRGASGVIVHRSLVEPPAEGTFAVVVPDTRRALAALATEHRRALTCRVVGITGSCGKTSTKGIAQHLLSPHVALVAAPSSFNNEIGVPLTLFRAGATTEVCLVEIGTNAPGEVAALAAVAAPDIGVVTSVGRAHLQGLGSLAGVLEEKAALLDALPEEGTAILNADDPAYADLRARAGDRRVVSYAVNRDADLRAESLRPRDMGVELHVVRADGARFPVTLPRPGQHNVRNLLAALGIGASLGLDTDALLEGVASLPPAPRRLEPKLAANGMRILDDSYNANPDSLLAALSVLDTLSAERKVLVLGDLLELGSCERPVHRDLGSGLAGRIDLLVAVGELASITADSFTHEGGTAVTFPAVDDLIAAGDALFSPGDLALFKGSRAMQLDRAVDALVASSE